MEKNDAASPPNRLTAANDNGLGDESMPAISARSSAAERNSSA
jgi:hypothetical protein